MRHSACSAPKRASQDRRPLRLRLAALIVAPAILSGAFVGPVAAGSILPAIERAHRLPEARAWDVGKHFVRIGDETWIAVKGRRERRQVRFSRLWTVWSPAQRQTALELGFPINRLLEISAGRETQTWSYPERHLQVVFDGEGRLIGRHAG